MSRGHGYHDWVSIVVVVHNRLDLTRACLRTVFEHTPEQFELVVVDNASTDGTAEWLAEFSPEREYPEGTVGPSQQFQRASLSVNVGYGRGANIGANLAMGRTLVFLNNDTEVHAGWLRGLLSALSPDDVGMSAGRLVNPDGSTQHTGVTLFYDNHGVLTAANETVEHGAGEAECLAGAASAFRAEAFREVGGYDPVFYNGYEDVDLCLRLRRAGWRLAYTPESVVVHHQHGSGAERWAHVQDNIRRLQERWANPQ